MFGHSIIMFISVPSGRFPRAVQKMRKNIVQSFPFPARSHLEGEGDFLSPSLHAFTEEYTLFND